MNPRRTEGKRASRATPHGSVDQLIATLAGRQHGVLSRKQLLASGVSIDELNHRARVGRIEPLHRGVYRVGPVEAPQAREMAACLACGAGAVVSHRSAAVLWGLLPATRRPAAVEISMRCGRPRRPGITIRTATTLRPDEVTEVAGIPLTTPPRTLLDLAATDTPRELERAAAEALASRLTTMDRIHRLATDHAGRPGARALLSVSGGAHPALTRSAAEDLFLALVRKARLDPPRTNVHIAGHEVDFFWKESKLVVEIDGFTFHSSRRAFERDRRRDAHLAAAGVRVMRITWRQLRREPEAILVTLVRGLATPAPTTPAQPHPTS